MHDWARLAMHEVRRANDLAPKRLPDRLMSQAHTEERSFPGKVPDQFDTDAGFMRSTRSGRHNDALRTHRLHFSYRDLIVAPDLNLLAQFTDILDKVVGEGIVVVENEDQAAKLLALRLHQNTE